MSSFGLSFSSPEVSVSRFTDRQWKLVHCNFISELFFLSFQVAQHAFVFVYYCIPGASFHLRAVCKDVEPKQKFETVLTLEVDTTRET